MPVTKSTLLASSLLAARPGKILIWVCDLGEPLETANGEVTHPVIEMSSNLNFPFVLGKSKKGSPISEGPASNSHQRTFFSVRFCGGGLQTSTLWGGYRRFKTILRRRASSRLVG